MNFSFFIFAFLSIVIMVSTLGHGLIFTKIFKLERFNYNFGIIGIFGLFLLSFVGSFSHLFFSHNYIHNLIVIFLGLTYIFFVKKASFKDFKLILIVFLLLFIAFVIAKTNEDFGYYHLPNSLQFSQQKLQFGLGNLNHGFKHISSIFMLMSLHYLPFIKFYLFNLTNYLFLVFFITFILIEIFNKNKENDHTTSLMLAIFFVLFLSKFNRLAEYGSDISGQILIFIFFFLYSRNLLQQKT